MIKDKEPTKFSVPLNISEVRLQIEMGHLKQVVERSRDILGRLSLRRKSIFETLSGKTASQEYIRLIIAEDPFLVATPVFFTAAKDTKQDFEQLISDLVSPREKVDRLALIEQILSYREYIPIGDEKLIKILTNYTDARKIICQYSAKFSPETIHSLPAYFPRHSEIRLHLNDKIGGAEFIDLFIILASKNSSSFEEALDTLDFHFQELDFSHKEKIINIIFSCAEKHEDRDKNIYLYILEKIDILGSLLDKEQINILAQKIGPAIIYFLGYFKSTPYSDSMNLASIEFESDFFIIDFFFETDNFLALQHWMNIKGNLLEIIKNEVNEKLISKIKFHWEQKNYMTCRDAIRCLPDEISDPEIIKYKETIDSEIAKQSLKETRKSSEKINPVIDVRRLVLRYILAAKMYNDLGAITSLQAGGMHDLSGMVSREFRREDIRMTVALRDFCESTITETRTILGLYLCQIVKRELEFQSEIDSEHKFYLPCGKRFNENNSHEEIRIFFRRAKVIFQKNWRENFGGRPWEIIADCGENIFKEDLTIKEMIPIIERVNQCQHNTGSIFKALPNTRWAPEINFGLLTRISDTQITTNDLLELMIKNGVLDSVEYSNVLRMEQWLETIVIHNENL